MGTKQPLVSIGMPVRNCEWTVAAAVRSVLLQTFVDWELLVIDNGSTDKTVDVVRSFKDPRVRLVIGQPGIGLSDSLNEAVRLSKGKYFARMDGDDVSYPSRLQRQLVPIGKRKAPEIHEEICAKPTSGFRLAHPTWFGKRDWFCRNPYQTPPIRAEDQALLLNTYRSSRFGNVPAILLGYREEDIQLNKLRRSRISYAKELWANSSVYGRWSTGWAIFRQIIKGIADHIAKASGLRWELLRHRAAPITLEERREWDLLWKVVNS